MNEGTAIVLLILGLMALHVLGSFLRNRQRVRFRQMAHQERMLALDRGMPVPDEPIGGDYEAWLNATSAERLLEGGWDRRLTPAAGLVTLFASIGALLFAWLMPPISEDAVGVKIALFWPSECSVISLPALCVSVSPFFASHLRGLSVSL
jgi:hypothetical protein